MNGPPQLAYLGLGSNLGDRAGALRDAREALRRRGVEVLREGSILETAPWGGVEQPAFLNQVLEVRWSGSPRELLAVAKGVEKELGRRRRRRWGPREIDVDILVIPGTTVAEPDLVVPHPRIGQREFVREGLRELDPGLDILGRQ